MSSKEPIRHTPIAKLLVANRGEIALRVMRSAKAMGIATVAVYSDADVEAAHVLAADQAIALGAAAPAQCYLNIDRIIEAAKRCAADAIHPGYGFLAENPDFAEACAAAGLRLVGPSAQAMRAMGHKGEAKRLMAQAGVPCIPGYADEDQDTERLAIEADRLGFPLMIKAAAGGGGRGMRLVHRREDFADLLLSARSEALTAFADQQMLLERAICDARHIEIQIVADRYGQVLHLGERDCSVQRRHQKIIEEAPSPAVNDELRERMGAAAVRAARAIDYEGVGTLEFLLDRDGNFYFMEMNTRLQVEHPVTEAITGLDLVELQLRIAAGEALELQQSDVQFNGHAIEARLCAEDPSAQFMPQSGQLRLWRAAATARVEHALHSSCMISPHYDSMIAKVIAHGSDREQARSKLLQALSDTVALGIPTNQAFLTDSLQHADFVAGQATTGFIAQHQQALLECPTALRLQTLAVAAALLFGSVEQVLAHRFDVPLRLRLDGTVYDLTLRHVANSRCQVLIGEELFELHTRNATVNDARLQCNEVDFSVAFCRHRDSLDLHLAGRAWRVEDLSRAAALQHAHANADGALRAAMNGRVVALAVAVGESVLAGQGILTLESMKMEISHRAPRDGRVVAIHVTVGDQVSAHALLAEVSPK